MAITSIPNFQLYGERTSFADPGFVHIETIESRSRLSGWEIHPHRHDTLDQLLVIDGGGATATFEGAARTLRAPAVIHVPAGTIHGFKFDEEIDGMVITFSVDLRAMLSAAQPGLRIFAGGPIAQGLTPTQRDRLSTLVQNLHLECSGHELGRIMADGWLVGLLLVQLARAVQDSALSLNEDGRAQRFRVLVDSHFREHRPISFYAASLGITERSLTRFVRSHFGCAPMQYIHRRILLEARRLLIYGNLSVAGVAEQLGFSDPSYFSRFYHRMTDERPSDVYG